jgi:HSP20 family protein
MALVLRPEPFARDIDRLFNTFFGPADGQQQQRFVPAIDLVEEGDHYLLRADLPGLAEEDVSIEVQDNTLTLSGERRQEERTDGEGYSRVERSYGHFSRSLTLPEGTDADAISASFDKGVLEVSIPKPEERKPRRVSIGVGGGQPKQVEGTASERPAS